MKPRHEKRAGRSGRELKNAGQVNAGVVGMGLMGTSIAACLLAAGDTVAAVEPYPSLRRNALRRVLALLKGLKKERVLKTDPSKLIERLTVSNHYSALARTGIVIESVVENLKIKQKIIRAVEEVVLPETLIGSNTSAIPATELQRGARHPERILGIHWAEPAHLTRFMEIICGSHTLPAHAQRALELARHWGKEPSLLRKDVRGFITNRIMYAMLREAFHLVEAGYATVADVDRSLRNDLGYWITLAGPFRFMDLTGIPAYEAVMRDLLPDLSCNTKVPALMRKLVRSGARGVSNAKGFYSYTARQARRWEELFLKFSYEIRALAQKYPENIGK
jgi:3-hydroxybutyryl-CoA dehydrogenase